MREATLTEQNEVVSKKLPLLKLFLDLDKLYLRSKLNIDEKDVWHIKNFFSLMDLTDNGTIEEYVDWYSQMPASFCPECKVIVNKLRKGIIL